MTTILVVIFIFIFSLLVWALYSKGETPAVEKEEKPEDQTLRRRTADKAIEEQFPDSEGHRYRRKEDIETIEEISKVEDDFTLPYTADEIIPENSKYWVYNRTLVNSEIYAMKGDIPTAISLYRGVYERVIDQVINTKIKANVDYLQEYQKIHLHRKSEALRQKAAEKKGNEIRLSLDGPLTIPEKIQIALTSPVHELSPIQELASKFDIDKIVDDIAEKVAAKQATDSKKDEEIDAEIQKLKEKNEEVSKLKDGILKLHDKLLDIHEESKKGVEEMKSKLQSAIEESSSIEEAGKEPVPEELKFQATPPKIDVPEPKKVEFQKEIKEKEDETEEIEVLSQFEKEEELSSLSDEDFFDKILKDDLTKKDESFEIVGYNTEDKAQEYGIIDKEQEEKQKEEEKFYRKFLRHGKRVRKELPILKVSYDFSKLPDEFSLSKDQNILQYSFYKYKPLLEKANELIRRRNVRDAINYYNVVKGQNIPQEFKVMLNKNIGELTEYIEKYLSSD